MLVQFAFTSHWWVLSLHSSRSKKKKRKQYKPPASYVVYKPKHSTQENNQFCRMLIERRASINPGRTLYNDLYGEAPPELRNGCLFQTSGVFEVYERVAKSVSFWSVKIRGRRRQKKLRWKSESAFFQSSSRLLQVTNFVKCRRTLLKLNSQELYPSSEREGKFRRRLCICSCICSCSFVVVVQWRQRNVQKSVMHVQNCCFAN